MLGFSIAIIVIYPRLQLRQKGDTGKFAKKGAASD